MCASITIKIFLLLYTGELIGIPILMINVNLVTLLLTNSTTIVDIVNESPTYVNSLDCVLQDQARSQKIPLGLLLKEMWTFSYWCHSANYSPGAVRWAYILWCAHSSHSWGPVNPSIDHVYSWNIHKNP